MFSEVESELHKEMKVFCYNNIPKYNQIKERDLEVDFVERKPDVVFKLENGNKIVVECQCSSMSDKELISRTKFYSNNGYYVLWLFNDSNIGEIIKEGSDNFYFAPSNLTKYSNFNFYWRCYYYNEQYKSISAIYLLHKKSHWVKRFQGHGGYSKKYKNRFYYSRNTVESLGLLCIENKGFKLVRFYDKYPNEKKNKFGVDPNK